MNNIIAASGQETFIRRFQGCSIVAVMTFTIAQGKPVEVRCDWSRRLKKRRLDRIYEEYKTWRAESWQVVIEKYQLGRILIIDT